MAKVGSVVARALRLIHVIDPQQPVKALDMQTGIEALNGMMRRWEANGLSVGWMSVDAPDDDLPCAEEAQDAVTFNLAVMLAPEYEQTPSQVVVAMAATGLADLRADVKGASPLVPDRFWSYGYDTRTDSWR